MFIYKELLQILSNTFVALIFVFPLTHLNAFPSDNESPGQSPSKKQKILSSQKDETASSFKQPFIFQTPKLTPSHEQCILHFPLTNKTLIFTPLKFEESTDKSAVDSLVNLKIPQKGPQNKKHQNKSTNVVPKPSIHQIKK